MEKPEKPRKHVLIAEDDEDLRPLVVDAFKEDAVKGPIEWMPVGVANGLEALLKVDNQTFDLLVVDFQMPRLGGVEFIQRLRQHNNSRYTPIFVVSGNVTPEAVPDFGRLKYFAKPIKMDDLVAHARTIVDPPKPQYALDVGVINAIIAAAGKVFSSFEITELKQEALIKKVSQDALFGDISSVVNIQSPRFKGTLCLSFDKKSYLHIVSKMFMEPQSTINSENEDAVAEINNMIFGNAKAQLESYQIQSAIPTIITGMQHKITHPSGSIGIAIPFSTPAGKFFIEIFAHPVAGTKA